MEKTMKNKHRSGNLKILFITLACIITFMPAGNLFARGSYHWHGHGWHRWYGPAWFGVYVGVSGLEIGAVVDALPYGYSTVIAGGIPYYYYNPYYYRAVPEGYMVVPVPATGSNPPAQAASVVSPAASGAPDVFTINIPNSKGGYNPVTLKKVKDGYTGPQGEFYPAIPSVAYLQALYGK